MSDTASSSFATKSSPGGGSSICQSKIRSQARQGALYAYPKEKSMRRFMDQVRQRTKRVMSLRTPELIAELNPLLRGWGEYYKRAQVRKVFSTSRRLDPATHLVASVPALAQSRPEIVACGQALRRVHACSVDRSNSFSCISASLSLHESCMREIRTCSLSGGRRLARKRASPTRQLSGNSKNSPLGS
jgi:hypothetical protein